MAVSQDRGSRSPSLQPDQSTSHQQILQSPVQYRQQKHEWRAGCTIPGGRKLGLAVSEARVYEQPVALGTGETFHRCYHLAPEFCTCTYIYATLEFRSSFNVINICKYKYMEYQYMDANLIMYLVRTSSGMHCRPNG